VPTEESARSQAELGTQIDPGGLTCELFVELLKKLMRGRNKPLHLVVDGLPAHKKAVVKAYVSSTKGRLTLHFLPGYAPELNPDELVWSHAKRTGNARRPLQKGEKLEQRVATQLAEIGKDPELVRSFFKHPNIRVWPIFLTCE
jgi:transposase